MDKNNKIKIVLLTFLTSLCSCNKDVSTKDMIGVWECSDHNRYIVIMSKDSCKIINYPELPQRLKDKRVLCAEWCLWSSSQYNPWQVHFFIEHDYPELASIYYNPFSSQFYLSVMDSEEDFYHYYRVTDTIPTDMDAFIKNHDRSNIPQWW